MFLKEYEKYQRVPIGDSEKNLCSIEYYYFVKFTRESVLAQYNLAIRDVLLKNDWIKEIYFNDMVSILKNNKPGVDCFVNNT